jgi:hypothetical protein
MEHRGSQPGRAHRHCKIYINLPQRPVDSNNDNTFVTLNNSKICLLAFTTSRLQPRVRAETYSVTTAPSPELSIIGTSFKSNTIRTFFSQASRMASFSSGTLSLVNRPKHSKTVQSSESVRCTRNPRPELSALRPVMLPLPGLHVLDAQWVVPHFRPPAQSPQTCSGPQSVRMATPDRSSCRNMCCFPQIT